MAQPSSPNAAPHIDLFSPVDAGDTDRVRARFLLGRAGAGKTFSCLEEVRRLRAFETPSQKVRRKAKLAAKRGKLKFRFNP